MFQSDLTRGDTIASEELLQSIREKEKTIVIAIPGSDEARLLDYFGANASVNTNDVNHIKDFMIRHQKILGLSHNDIAALIIMKNSYIKGLE